MGHEVDFLRRLRGPTAGLAVLLAVIGFTATDTAPALWRARGRPGAMGSSASNAYEGMREPRPTALLYDLRAAAFPDAGGASVAVHVPPGFDPNRRPGLIVYFHGWQGCVAASLASDDTSCVEGGQVRHGAALAEQVDAAGVNAILVAVELRSELPSGEPGEMASPGGLRRLLRELFAEHLSPALGCALDVDGLDRVVVVAHSGGYQAAASVLRLGDVAIAEVDLLDSLYGADEVFTSWVRDGVRRFDPRLGGPRRFVDLYTCCGGTVDHSRTLANAARNAACEEGWRGAFFDDDRDGPLDERALGHAFVFKRVVEPHSELPRAYMQLLARFSGFARIGGA